MGSNYIWSLIIKVKSSRSNSRQTMWIREPVRDLTKGLSGSLYADKGYLSQPLVNDLAKAEVTFITKKRRNMKAQVLAAWDKLMLSKRFIIESVPQAYKLAA